MKNLNSNEIIERTFFLISVEIGDFFNVNDIITVLENNITSAEFYKWMNENNAKELFFEWLIETGLDAVYE